MPVDAHIEASPDQNATEWARRQMASESMRTVRLVDFRGDANAERPADYYIYIYNIAQRKFEVRRPPNFPLITFAGCPPKQPYALVGRVPNVVNEKWIDGPSGEVRFRGIQGERFATDLLNPSNLGIDIWADVPDEISWIDGGTDDLTRRGVFWSPNAEPTQEELDRCRVKMEKHYKALIAQADILYQDPATRREIGREHHLAADYFKARSQWHIIAEVPSICPNCGESTRTGVLFHVNSIGMMCIQPTQEAWKKAILTGIVKRDAVPEELRWWEQPKDTHPGAGGGKMKSA